MLRAVGDFDGVTDALSYWAFSDVFEEVGLPMTEFAGVYGLETNHGIAKPVRRAFELLHRHSGSCCPPRRQKNRAVHHADAGGARDRRGARRAVRPQVLQHGDGSPERITTSPRRFHRRFCRRFHGGFDLGCYNMETDHDMRCFNATDAAGFGCSGSRNLNL